MTPICADIGALIAGGEGNRLGGRDKGMILLGGRSLHEIAIDKLGAHCGSLVAAAPRRPRWLSSNVEVAFVSDQTDVDDNAVGPLGGLASALLWGHAQVGAGGLMFTAPIDAPFFPASLPCLLACHLQDADVIAPRHDGRVHPLFAVWRVNEGMHVYDAIMDIGVRAVQEMVLSRRHRVLDVAAPAHAFLNINRSADLEEAEALIKRHGPGLLSEDLCSSLESG